jgi:hypothetical protein
VLVLLGLWVHVVVEPSPRRRRVEQFGQIGKAGRSFGNQACLSGSNWIMKKNGDCAEPVYFVGVPITGDFEHLAATITEANAALRIVCKRFGGLGRILSKQEFLHAEV